MTALNQSIDTLKRFISLDSVSDTSNRVISDAVSERLEAIGFQVEQTCRNNKIQDAVPEKFQAFIIQAPQTSMRQGQTQQVRVAKAVGYTRDFPHVAGNSDQVEPILVSQPN